MFINYIFAFLLIKITTTTSNQVNLSNKWSLLAKAGLEDGKDDFYIFMKFVKKMMKIHISQTYFDKKRRNWICVNV